VKPSLSLRLTVAQTSAAMAAARSSQVSMAALRST
jgi:hypothetical protein